MTLEDRVTQLEEEITELTAAVEHLGRQLVELRGPIDNSPTRTYGGQYRESLLAYFRDNPQGFHTPGAIAKALNLTKGHAVPIRQACIGLSREKLVVRATSGETGRDVFGAAK